MWSACLLCAAFGSCAAQFEFRILNAPGGGTSDALACDGTLVGGQASLTAPHAYLWETSANSFLDINPTGYSTSLVSTIRAGTQGGFARPVGFGRHAAMWHGTASSFVDLHPAGYRQSQVISVEGDLQFGSAEAPGYPFYWDHAGMWSGTAASWVDLNPSGARSSQIYDSRNGQQVGWFSLADASERAGIWYGTAASFVSLNPPGAGGSEAFATDGVTQGGYAAVGQYHASLWHGTPESWVDLHPNGAVNSYVTAIAGPYQMGSASYWNPAIGNYTDHPGYWMGSRASWTDLLYTIPSNWQSGAYVNDASYDNGVLYFCGSLGGYRGYEVVIAVPEANSLVVMAIACGCLLRRFARASQLDK